MFRDSCICTFVFGLGAPWRLVAYSRESPSPRASRVRARSEQMHAPLARRLFAVGFTACGASLTPASRESLIASIEAAITAPTTPTEAMLELLAIAEYIERERPAAAA